MSPARPVADPLQEILCLARLYLSEGEAAARLVVWLAHRVGRNPALAGDRPEIERLEHVARHWLTPMPRSRLPAPLTLDGPESPVPGRGAS